MGKKNLLKPLVLLEDEPVSGYKVDELGLRPFSTTVASAAIGTTGPFVIGVFGDWGHGKTSVLRQAKSLIEASDNSQEVVTVWFNAWQYEKDDHPVIPLIATIIRAVDQKLAERKEAKDQIASWWKSVTRALRSAAYGFSTTAKVGIPGFGDVEAEFVAKEMIERYEKLKSEGDPLLDRSLYFNAFEILSQINPPLAQSDNTQLPKIVVFVDDLDRCMPDQGLRLLESLKLVFAQKGFIFVLALDRRVLDGYIEKRYQQEFNVQDYRDNSTSYLDKIIQLPLTIPAHQSRFENYITRLLKRRRFAKQTDEVEALKDIVYILSDGSNYNPRGLVRFLNTLLVDHRIGELMGKADNKAFLPMCAISRSLQNHLDYRDYRTLVTDNALCDAIANSSKAISERWTPTKKDLIETKRQRVLAALERHQFLVKILDDKRIGHPWLTQHPSRKNVDEFLDQRLSEVSSKQEEELTGLESELLELVIRDKIDLADVAKQKQLSYDEAVNSFALAVAKMAAQGE